MICKFPVTPGKRPFAKGKNREGAVTVPGRRTVTAPESFHEDRLRICLRSFFPLEVVLDQQELPQSQQQQDSSQNHVLDDLPLGHAVGAAIGIGAAVGRGVEDVLAGLAHGQNGGGAGGIGDLGEVGVWGSGTAF